MAPCIDYETFRGEPVYPKDPKSIHHPVTDRMRVEYLRCLTEEQHAPPHLGSPGTSPARANCPALI
ncbi:MAG: hypothetical protein WC406_02115 [Methanoregula sp.]